MSEDKNLKPAAMEGIAEDGTEALRWRFARAATSLMNHDYTLNAGGARPAQLDATVPRGCRAHRG